MRFVISPYLIFLFAGSTIAAGQQTYGPPPPPSIFHRPSCTDKIRDNCLPAPQPISSPPPTYSEEARKAKIEGDCIVSLVVDEKGNPTNLHVVSGLGMGLDEKAIEAIKTWKYKPAFRDGKPIAAKLFVKVSFHL